ncbi:hypothetical protein H6G41_08255 [Tolypothrix sp. FACHB-123]|uniref:hypothetical protein n=1 Tax=Tolypothrix sp. FACHB-123 TaxID=2692868 RepID=UPI0016840FC6|nr:hypothetical protein [Tolypothrix sp. FACHB-123]MBD2354621.1 hypothetical protein [Tolypothrix sp. FACHB-123]
MRKNRLFCLDILTNSQFLPWAAFGFIAAIVLVGDRAVAENAVLRSIFSCQAQGLSGVVPTIKIWYQQGTNLSFIPSGEKIRKVWLNDPSQVTIDFDGPMCMQFGQGAGTGDCQNSSANVMQLRRIKKLAIPGLPHTNNTLLTVITEGGQNTKLYTFRILYGDGSPEYHTLAVFPDTDATSTSPCVRPPQ